MDASAERPDTFLDRALAVPILQPRTPLWGRQPSSVAAKPGPAQIFFPKWKQHPSSVFRRPEIARPPASAPAHSIFAQRRERAPARGVVLSTARPHSPRPTPTRPDPL